MHDLRVTRSSNYRKDAVRAIIGQGRTGMTKYKTIETPPRPNTKIMVTRRKLAQM